MQVHLLGTDHAVVAIEPDINLAPAETAHEVCRCGGKTEKLSGLLSARAVVEDVFLGEIRRYGRGIPVLPSRVGERQDVEHAHLTAGKLSGIPPVLGLVLLDSIGVGQWPVEPYAIRIVPEGHQGRPDSLPGVLLQAVCRAHGGSAIISATSALERTLCPPIMAANWTIFQFIRSISTGFPVLPAIRPIQAPAPPPQ